MSMSTNCKYCSQAITIDKKPDGGWLIQEMDRDGYYTKHVCKVDNPKFSHGQMFTLNYISKSNPNRKYPEDTVYKVNAIVDNKHYDLSVNKKGKGKWEGKTFWNKVKEMPIQFIDKYANQINEETYKVLYG